MSQPQTFSDRVWDFFCSLKLAIVTLIILALTSIIGTVIEQNKPPQHYLQNYGMSESTYQLLDTLQFFDMYRSWWFLGLMGLFAVNLICCSIKRFPGIWKIVSQPRLVADDGLFRTFSNRDELLIAGSVESVRDKLTGLLGARFAAPTVTEQDGKIHLFAQKGKYARLGVYVTHASILIIFIGAMIGNVFGYKAYVNIVEGSSIDKVWPRAGQEPIDIGFEVRCDNFEVEFYEGGRPKLFSSDLVVLEGGQEVLKKTIIVNDPLTYKGLTFYQSSYGPAGDPTFRFRVTARDSGETVEVNARQGQRVALPGGGSFVVNRFAQNYDNFGPAVQMQTTGADGRQGNPFIVLQNFADFDVRRGGAYSFSLLESDQRYYTGLQVAKDPGVWVVWLGCFLMVFGSLTAFFWSHRRLWAVIEPLDKGVGVKIGGSAHRNQPAFTLFFDELKKDVHETLKS
ncbi:MAG: cytochrome c biogenesis protein ResB [Desulfuromonadales bacterium]|nr:cytochrome c biogenesis protein ResB [Desulfuromonadales bacterium]